MGRFIRSFGRVLSAILPAALVLIGAAAVAVGVGIIYMPAGVIAGGVLTAFAGVVLIKGGGDAA